MLALYYSRMESPIGPLVIGVSQEGLALIEWDRGEFPESRLARMAEWQESEERTMAAKRQLREYFAGKRQVFDVKVDLHGTEFQKKCWRALLNIPYGQTRTYAQIAKSVGKPRGFRAVGMANHDNPVPIVVPCHRVLASDGTLGGYGGGLEVKRKLLELEGALQPTLL
ncbi:MAG: methylated-DNA--[protein]-cysteine S-methyltransferase [Terriglobia bacterium]|jgi:O-6-methylguanine DNA methyltransferase|nr:methylated-DNA--[protein]-cysteine S-methyltransferase [Terriglobia bacterium]